MNITALQRKELLRQLETEGNLAIMASDQSLIDLRKNLEIALLNLTDVKNIWKDLQDKLILSERAADKLRDMGYAVRGDAYHSSGSGTSVDSHGKSLSVCDCGMLSKRMDEALQPVKDLKRGLSERISAAQTDVIMSESLDDAKKAMWDFQSMISDIQDKLTEVIKGSGIVRV